MYIYLLCDQPTNQPTLRSKGAGATFDRACLSVATDERVEGEPVTHSRYTRIALALRDSLADGVRLPGVRRAHAVVGTHRDARARSAPGATRNGRYARKKKKTKKTQCVRKCNARTLAHAHTVAGTRERGVEKRNYVRLRSADGREADKVEWSGVERNGVERSGGGGEAKGETDASRRRFSAVETRQWREKREYCDVNR